MFEDFTIRVVGHLFYKLDEAPADQLEYLVDPDNREIIIEGGDVNDILSRLRCALTKAMENSHA